MDVSETEKLETIIHQIEKEKLKLEKQLSVKMSYEEVIIDNSIITNNSTNYL